MAIFRNTKVLRSFPTTFQGTTMRVDVWRVHDGYNPEYYYAIYLSNEADAMRFMDERAISAGLPMFIKKVMMGDEVTWYGGAGYKDFALPNVLGPFLDQVAGEPLPLEDDDQPFDNPAAPLLPDERYVIGGRTIERRKGVYTRARYYRVFGGSREPFVMTRCSIFSDGSWNWYPTGHLRGELEELHRAGRAVDRYERASGILVPPDFETLVPADKW